MLDDHFLLGAGFGQLLLVLGRPLAERFQLTDDPGVLRSDPAVRIQHHDDLLEALRPEEHLDEPGRFAVHVEVAESGPDARLRFLDAAFRADEISPGRVEFGADLFELVVGAVPALRGVADLGVELMHLLEDRLRLSPLLLDRRGRGRADRAEQGKENPGETEDREREADSETGAAGSPAGMGERHTASSENDKDTASAQGRSPVRAGEEAAQEERRGEPADATAAAAAPAEPARPAAGRSKQRPAISAGSRSGG